MGQYDAVMYEQGAGERALDIVAGSEGRLGPRCIPCHHNTLSFADGTDAYYHSRDRRPSPRT